MCPFSHVSKTTVTAEPAIIPESECRLENAEEPFVMTIFGASGDLAKRKLFPALFSLFETGAMPETFRILGTGRSELERASFVESLREFAPGAKRSLWDEFMAKVDYVRVDLSDQASFSALGERMDTCDTECGAGGNKLYYLAVPPRAYGPIATGLGKAGLSSSSNGFVRLVIEKPFGSDLASSRKLDDTLHEHFREEQIYRIDHYLAKETVRNILVLRFANAIFEPLWNRRYIDSIRILAAEKLGVEHRAEFYDSAGVLRDMFQNHMMQLLALCAMEPPSLFEADLVRDEKAKVYRSIRPFDPKRLHKDLILGQYSSGSVGDAKVPSYLDEPGVAPDSITPTFASLKLFIDNWRWQGVPFFITSGKRMMEKRTEITVTFKPVPHTMFRNLLGESITANRLTLSIQPDEAVAMSFQTKTPGPMCLRTVTMNFNYAQGFTGPVLSAYAKLIMDVLLGDRTLFWRQDSIDLSWSFLDPILKASETDDMHEDIHLYKAGTWGPKSAWRFIGV